MEGKKGVLRIIEASISVVLVMGVLFFLFVKNNSVESFDYGELERDLLEEIAKNVSLRNAVLDSTGEDGFVQQGTLFEFLDRRIENNVNFEARICDLSAACGASKFIEQVYVQERIISADVKQSNYMPKKIRIFIWENE